MDDLHVNSEFTTTIGKDEDTDRAAATLEGFVEAGVEVGLVENWERLLDITCCEI